MGIPVKAIKTILRGQTYLPPGTVYEYPDQASADYAIGRGMVTAVLNQPIKATPEYELTADGKQVEIPADASAGSEAPPASFITDPSPVIPAVSNRGQRDNRGNRR